MGFPILTILIVLPLIGAAFLLTVRGEEGDVARNARNTALFTSVFNLGIALYLLFRFDPGLPGFQFVEHLEWFPHLGLAYHLGVDGISIYLVILAALLTPLCILASWQSIQRRVREYMISFLVLEALMIGTFTSLDLFLFYVFFEGVLIPMFFIIGIWGGPRRVYAAFKFFLFTLLGSLLMLVAFVTLAVTQETTSIPELLEQAEIMPDMQAWLFWAMFASFAVKLPMWPVHTWLPDAHVEAPTAGSVILAGVLLKMGGYGFLRFSLPMLPEASMDFAPVIMILSVAAIIYTSLVALVQSDIKKMIAYSSVAHMGFVMLGMFSLTQEGLQGAVFQMLSHGVISGALFLAVGVLYDRMHTRDIARYGGVVRVMPRFAVLFAVFMLGSVGLPGTSGFIGEFLAILGTFQVQKIYATLAALGMVLGAAYMLWLMRRIFYGAPAEGSGVEKLMPLTMRELTLLLPLAGLVIVFGFFPQPVLDDIAQGTVQLIDYMQDGGGNPK